MNLKQEEEEAVLEKTHFCLVLPAGARRRHARRARQPATPRLADVPSPNNHNNNTTFLFNNNRVAAENELTNSRTTWAPRRFRRRRLFQFFFSCWPKSLPQLPLATSRQSSSSSPFRAAIWRCKAKFTPRLSYLLSPFRARLCRCVCRYFVRRRRCSVCGNGGGGG